jgi:hypothetical protein
MTGFGGAEVHFGDTLPEEAIQPVEEIVGLILPTQLDSSDSDSDSEDEIDLKTEQSVEPGVKNECKVRTFGQ